MPVPGSTMSSQGHRGVDGPRRGNRQRPAQGDPGVAGDTDVRRREVVGRDRWRINTHSLHARRPRADRARRPLGSWVSSQSRWALTSQWLGAPLTDMEPAAAHAELVRCWLRRFGPGTTTDIKWWTGWTVHDTRAALAMLDAVEVDLDDGPGWLLADDLDPVEPASDWVALLPGLDSTVMGWKEHIGPREHTPALLRPQWERRPDRLVERKGRRRLGAARERRGRRPPPRRSTARARLKPSKRRHTA